jgi:hypothetical protein
MTRNHFSKHSGPYFINDGLSKHIEKKPCVDPSCSSTMAKIKKFFQLPRPKDDKQS